MRILFITDLSKRITTNTYLYICDILYYFVILIVCMERERERAVVKENPLPYYTLCHTQKGQEERK